MGLDCSFTKLYQIVKVESGEPDNPTAYRLQENANFSYEECFCENYVKEPQWFFVEMEVFDNAYDAVGYAFCLYNSRIMQKWEEYKKIKNQNVLEVITWDKLNIEVERAVHANGIKWPKPPVQMKKRGE